MAKKKTSKDSESKKVNYSVELNGLLLILIGLIGFGNFGPVGKIIKNFAIFLMGTWYAVVLFLVLFLGIYMVFKRKLPKFFSSRLVGFYILMLAILIFSHVEYVNTVGLKGKEILEATIDNFMSAANDYNTNIGGGVIGALFSVAFMYLFDITGTKIVVYVLSFFGLVMMLDVTIGDLFKKIGSFFKWIFKKRGKEKVKSEDEEVEAMIKTKDNDDKNEKEDDKIIITSMDEIKTVEKENVSDDLKQIVQEEKSSSGVYTLPPLDILDPVAKENKNSTEFLKNNKNILERVLTDFQIKGKVVEIHPGPSVTQYEVKIESGTKVSKIVSIKDELKLALAVKEIRIQAPIPGKSTIGVEIPNQVATAVRLKEGLGNISKSADSYNLLVVLGKDIMGRNQYADITKMPHLLVSGSTGSGKSVCMNIFIVSLLMRYRPDQLKLVLIDPKKVEFSNYSTIPHLLCPVVTDPKKASLALKRIVVEMERRYDLFSEKGTKNFVSYNEYVEKENKRHPDNLIKPLPYIIVIIDELADLMLIAAKEVEDSIMRITQMARAAGIHLIVATQRPSTDVITGVVKANIPSRIAFAVSSNVDSRTILDMSGAEKLIGKGDMLYLPMGENQPVRIQGSFISDDEIKRVIDFVSKEETATFDMNMTSEETKASADVEEYDDPLYNEIVEFAIKTGKISASLIQRRFRLGYNRAARVIDLLEERGIIGPMNGSKPREVLVKLEEKE